MSDSFKQAEVFHGPRLQLCVLVSTDTHPITQPLFTLHSLMGLDGVTSQRMTAARSYLFPREHLTLSAFRSWREGKGLEGRGLNHMATVNWRILSKGWPMTSEMDIMSSTRPWVVEEASLIKEILGSFLWAYWPAPGLCEAWHWLDKGIKGKCGACSMGTADAFIFLVATAYLRPQMNCGPSLLGYQLFPFKLGECKMTSLAHSEWCHIWRSGSAPEQRESSPHIEGKSQAAAQGQATLCKLSHYSNCS